MSKPIQPIQPGGPLLIPGLKGNSDNYIGVLGTSNSYIGVEGTSGSIQKAPSPAIQAGVAGYSDQGIGVFGSSDQSDAIQGISNSPQHAGVSASNNSTPNPGQTPYAVWANCQNGVGLLSQSGQQDAIQGVNKSTQGHAGVSGFCNGTGFGVWGKSASGTGVYGTGAQYAALFDGKLQVNGDGHVTGTLQVDIDIVLPSADCAEEFDVGSRTDLEPGTVMVFDDNETVTPCASKYDRRVAGVISGAGKYRPGLILGHDRSSATRTPLALVGRVFCKVDAQYGSVQIGDLLTTSPTVGHAMKATDSTLAFGAVIGKALGRLQEGCGMIPILVALQ